MKPRGARSELVSIARSVGALALLLQAAACRAPHELSLFEEKPPKEPPKAMPAPCPPEAEQTTPCTECTTDTECGAAKPACVAGRCVACSTDEHCSKDQVCNPVAAQCTKPCTQSEDCSEKDRKACDLNAAYCVECVVDTDCTKADRPRCEIQAGACVACIEDTDCSGAKAHCSASHACVECVAEPQCPDAGGCELDAATCTVPKP
jgi:hypothetical protein